MVSDGPEVGRQRFHEIELANFMIKPYHGRIHITPVLWSQSGVNFGTRNT